VEIEIMKRSQVIKAQGMLVSLAVASMAATRGRYWLSGFFVVMFMLLLLELRMTGDD
jgi:hypothetical protein